MSEWMSNAALWSAAFAVPLIVAALIAVGGIAPVMPGLADDSSRQRGPRLLSSVLCRFGWLAVLPAALLVVLGGDQRHHLDWMLLGTTVELDRIGRPLLAMTVVLYGLALAFIPRSGSARAPTLSAYVLVCFVGNAGVFAAADVITFYLAFTVMSVCGYALVVHSRSDAARRAANIYLVLTILGEAAVLAGLLLVVVNGGLLIADAPAAVAAAPERNMIIALLLVGFGIKAGTVPLHVWLPLAHPAAPTPASAVLSGAMVKAGLVGWLRFLPLGEVSLTGWGTAFMAVALIGGFLAVPIGLLQDNPKVILAYSTISQMGFLAAMIGAALAFPQLAPLITAAAVVYAVHHGLAKGVLFLGVQAWDTERLSRPVVVAVLTIAAAAIAGLPMTAGYFAKYVAKESVGDAGFPTANPVVGLADTLVWVGFGSTLLLTRLAVVMWRRERAARPTPVPRDLAWALVAVATVWPVAALAGSGDTAKLAPSWWSASPWWAQSWPVLLGLAAAVGAAALSRRHEFEDSPMAHPDGRLVPPGDVIAIEERAARALITRVDRGLAAADRVGRALRDGVLRIPSPADRLGRTVTSSSTWTASGTMLLVAVALVAVWALWGGN